MFDACVWFLTILFSIWCGCCAWLRLNCFYFAGSSGVILLAVYFCCFCTSTTLIVVVILGRIRHGIGAIKKGCNHRDGISSGGDGHQRVLGLIGRMYK